MKNIALNDFAAMAKYSGIAEETLRDFADEVIQHVAKNGDSLDDAMEKVMEKRLSFYQAADKNMAEFLRIVRNIKGGKL